MARGARFSAVMRSKTSLPIFDEMVPLSMSWMSSTTNAGCGRASGRDMIQFAAGLGGAPSPITASK